MNFSDLDTELKGLARSLEQREDYLAVVEAELRAQQVRRALLPGSQPVADGYVGSGYGWRTDPFTKEMTRHEGIDFAAPVGTPIHAAAGGVVVAAEYHPVWGNVVEIDHGNQLLTRYAHASRLLVKPGELVKRGRTPDCRSRVDRPLDRSAPALRGPQQGRCPESGQVPLCRRQPAAGGTAKHGQGRSESPCRGRCRPQLGVWPPRWCPSANGPL